MKAKDYLDVYTNHSFLIFNQFFIVVNKFFGHKSSKLFFNIKSNLLYLININ